MAIPRQKNIQVLTIIMNVSTFGDSTMSWPKQYPYSQGSYCTHSWCQGTFVSYITTANYHGPTIVKWAQVDIYKLSRYWSWQAHFWSYWSLFYVQPFLNKVNRCICFPFFSLSRKKSVIYEWFECWLLGKELESKKVYKLNLS